MPLDTTQINALGHFIDHIQYKQLAKMYVSRMTLDEKLGQLFMVQSYDQYYSPALEMMVDQLQPLANGPVTAASAWRIAPTSLLYFVGPHGHSDGR